MSWQFSPYVAALLLTVLLSVIAAYFALRLRDKPGGLPLGLLMLAVAEWSFALALESAAVGIPAKIFWSKVEYLGITSSPVLLLMFAWEFAHQRKWQNRHRLILWIIPIITLGLSTTNEWHHLIWTSFTPSPIPGSNTIIYGHGTWFWIAVTYFYLVLCTASVLLIRTALNFRHLYRRQVVVLLVSMIPPWAGNVLYVFELGPVPGQDLTPIGFALTGIMLTWSFKRLQLFDLAPVARDKVIEDMSDGMLVLDAQNRIVDINPAAEKLIGVDAKSAIGQQAETVLARWAGLVDLHRDVLQVQTQVLVDGTDYTELRISPLYERGDRFSGRLIILRDITERKRAEEALKEYSERLDVILRSTTDGIVVTNEEGSIVQANPVAQAWFTQTLSPEEAGRLREAVRSVARQACAEETRLRPEAQPEGFSGKNPVSLLELTGLDLELSAAPISPLSSPPASGRGREGMKAAVVVDIHDVTHLKALDRMKTRFITNISHELRTPITAIKLYAYLMQQHPEKWKQYLAPLAQEADHQARLVQGILQIAHIDAGRLEMDHRPTPLNELTEATVVRHRVLAQERGLTLEHHPETGFFGKNPVSLVDPERIMQVLDNLIGNAIRYTPEGGTVVVSTGTEEAEGRTWATVMVADTGIGIPEHELPHLFERFFRGEESQAMQVPGTGLGLAIVKEIVELHGGRVTVESPSILRRGSGQATLRASEEGVGSTFTIWLPLAD